MIKPCPLDGCRWNLGHHNGVHQDPAVIAEWITQIEVLRGEAMRAQIDGVLVDPWTVAHLLPDTKPWPTP